MAGTRFGSAEPLTEVSELPDRVLWGRAHDGDIAAFGVLFERHASLIYNYCFRRTADWALAEDLTSATFLLACEKPRPRAPAGGERAPAAIWDRDQRGAQSASLIETWTGCVPSPAASAG